MAERELDDVPVLPRAKPLMRRLPLATEPPAFVPARMINEALYCERLMYLEWAQGEFVDNEFTLDGRAVHARADVAGGELPPTPDGSKRRNRNGEGEGDDDDDKEDAGPPPYQARSLWLSSPTLGITAKIDVVEGSEAGIVIPIEYKRGAAPEVPEGAHLPERAQVCAQVLLLREHGYLCDHGEIYFARTRRRVRIEITAELIETTREAARRARELTALGVLPPPLVDSKRCEGCSLVGVCLPDEVNLLRGVAPEGEALSPASVNAMDEFWPVIDDPVDGSDEPEVVLRRLQPARDDEVPLYVQEQGARISVSGEELIVRGKKGKLGRACRTFRR